jgi:hypothetical protein
MNRSEVQNLLKQFSASNPAYAQWRTTAAQEHASAFGLDPAKAWGEMLGSIARTLQGTTEAEARLIVDRIETNDLECPPYGELARFIRREAARSRQPASHIYDPDRAVNCQACGDRGLANAWNPRFIEIYRQKFAKVTREEIPRDELRGMMSAANAMVGMIDLAKLDPDETIPVWRYDPPNWEYLANLWWHSEARGLGPIHHVALCTCDCERRRRLASELEDYRNNSRLNTEKKKALAPACGNVKYNAEVMPLKTPSSFEDLHGWYAAHEVSDVYAWAGGQSDDSNQHQ